MPLEFMKPSSFRKPTNDIAVTLTPDEFSLVLSAVGAILATMGADVPAGQPASSQMVMLEALQAKLMKVNQEQSDPPPANDAASADPYRGM
jgi:hypothetical protein